MMVMVIPSCAIVPGMSACTGILREEYEWIGVKGG